VTEESLVDELRTVAAGQDDEIAALLESAADRIREQQGRLQTLETELEETNEGMVALTLELQEAEERYRSLFETAVEGIYKTTPDGSRYVMANASMAAVLGYDTPESLQRSVDDVATDVFVDTERYEEYRTRLSENDEIESFEYRVRRRDGEVRWVADNARRLYDDGAPAGYRGGVIDITELKAYEDRLQRRNEELEALNRVLRHDIQNDMQVVRGSAEYLLDRVEPDERDVVAKIHDTSDHVIGLTENARTFIETLEGAAEPDLEPTPVRDLLLAELDRQRDTTDASFELTTTVPSVDVTANQLLSSVFRNLMTNAVNHNDSNNPRVKLSTTLAEDHVEIRVADNGPGVPDERKDDIFGKGAQSVASEGTGIGLYLVNQLVENYNGEVWVEDRAGGGSGAVFVLRIPLA